MPTKIILKSDSFKYPTKEERKHINNSIPKISQLKIKYKSAAVEIFQNKNFDNAIRNEDIFWWNGCLNNRLGKLTETYIYLQTHFIRIHEISQQELESLSTDKLLLDYYIEIFYYYFFSTRDVLAQLLNVVNDMKIEEHKIFFNEKFIKKIESEKIRGLLLSFFNNTRDSYNIRNSFNHRFTPNHIDNRAKKNIVNENNMINFYTPQKIKTEKFINDIENLMKYFNYLIDELNNELNYSTGTN